MSDVVQAVYSLLDEMQISYELTEHPPVYTIEEMISVDIKHPDNVVKNLFLRDDKKRNYFLVVMDKDKQVNLKELKDKLESRPLRFASEDDLYKYLKLTKGAVTPFGVINDENHQVAVVIDNVLKSYEFIGIHPNTNTATVWIAVDDLVRLVEKQGNPIIFMDV
ncbi:MAG: prolyl-tRNA synthetase associated domain-containing protein [Desulfovibrionaceae bacterium]|nr:prolyl-tRNA synthetase associated domain-containing protein [Desulfovibrionaceae bacterium]